MLRRSIELETLRSAIRPTADQPIGRNPCRPDDFRWVPVIWMPPYDPGSMRNLGGLAEKFMGGHPKAISPNGKWLAGASAWTTWDELQFTGTYWRVF